MAEPHGVAKDGEYHGKPTGALGTTAPKGTGKIHGSCIGERLICWYKRSGELNFLYQQFQHLGGQVQLTNQGFQDVPEFSEQRMAKMAIRHQRWRQEVTQECQYLQLSHVSFYYRHLRGCGEHGSWGHSN